MSIQQALHKLNFFLTEHPNIVNFRWNNADSWGSTWSFLATSIATYITAAIFVHLLLLLLLRRSRRPIPLGPIPAIHSLIMVTTSVVIFIGILLSATSEIRHTRWLWHRTRTTNTFQWLLCFPVGTRPSGRVFFWSYMYYLSRFGNLLRTFLTILRRRELSIFQVLNQSMLLCMSFLWLEFSQSFQVLGILLTTLLYAVIYGYRFWTAIGLRKACFPFVVNCQVVLLGCNLVCHVGVLMFHLMKGCNGIGAWGFNSVLNGAILLGFLKFYVGMYLKRKKFGACFDDGGYVKFVDIEEKDS